MPTRNDAAVRHAVARGRAPGSAPHSAGGVAPTLADLREDFSCGCRGSQSPLGAGCPPCGAQLPCAGLRASYSNCDAAACPLQVPPSLCGPGWTTYGGGCGARRDTPGCAGLGNCGEYYSPFPVALGYAAYVSPTTSPAFFTTAYLGPWRVAVPAAYDYEESNQLLERINAAGPQAAGYRRFGNTLVPAYLDAVGRRRVALSLV